MQNSRTWKCTILFFPRLQAMRARQGIYAGFGGVLPFHAPALALKRNTLSFICLKNCPHVVSHPRSPCHVVAQRPAAPKRCSAAPQLLLYGNTKKQMLLGVPYHIVRDEACFCLLLRFARLSKWATISGAACTRPNPFRCSRTSNRYGGAEETTSPTQTRAIQHDHRRTTA